MTKGKFLRSVVAMVLLMAMLVGILPMAFAAETVQDGKITLQASQLAELTEETSEEALLQAIYDQYGFEPVETEDPEFGTLANIDPDAKGATKDDSISTTYVFLDLKPGQSSRNFNWQVKSDSAKDQYFSANMQGCLTGYFQGSDARLYMPVELGDDYINGRLKQYQLKSGDIARVRIQAITANDTFVSGSAGTVASYFAVHTDTTSKDPGTWQSFGSNQTLKTQPVEQTLTWTVSSGLVGQKIRGVRWDPSQSDIPETRMYVDYIYIGPAAYAPVKVEYRNEANSSILGYHYVGYGKYANGFSTGKTNTETDTTQTIWGWQVMEYKNGAWTDINKFVTDPAKHKCTVNTRFVLKSVTIRKETLNSKQTYDNGASTEDDKYVLTVDGFDTAEMTAGGHGTPLDIAILLDRSGSQADLVTNNKCTTAAQVAEKVAKLSHAVQPGYYRATCFRKNKDDGTRTGGFDCYLYTMPMRYYRGEWQMQCLVNCSCDGTYHNTFGIYQFNTTGMKPCSHVKWVSMEEGFNYFKSYASTTGYTVGSTYTINGVSEKLQFNFGASRLGRAQNALVSFCASVYNSSHNLPAGQTHTISVIGYGATVFADKYPFNNGNGSAASNYIITSGKNYSACTKASTAVNVSNYESIIKAIRDTYCNGATRTDFAFQALTGTMSDYEKKNDKLTLTKTDYLPAVTTGRNRVVILMTDGVPTSNSEFSSEVANKAITAAKTLKGAARTTVYALGILSSLDDATYYKSGGDNMNNFMNLISSRYPSASSMTSTGTKVTGDYYISDTSSGSQLATQMEKVWTDTDASLAASGKTGPASLWLYEDFGREWKPDEDDTLKIWGEAYAGSGKYSGTKVLIGEHKVSDHTKNQSFTGNGYKLHYYYDSSDQSFTYALQWTDAKTAFLRETVLSTGSQAKALSGTALDVSKGYKVYMEMPIEANRDNTVGGNNIPITTSMSGCYQAKDANDTEIGTRLYSYSQPNANVYMGLDNVYVRDYYLSEEDLKAMLAGETNVTLEEVLNYIVTLPDDIRATNGFGMSTFDYCNYALEVSVADKDGSYITLLRRTIDKSATFINDIFNVDDSIVDLTGDLTFRISLKNCYSSHNVDSYGRDPYEDVHGTVYGHYYVPEITEEPTEPTEPPTEPTEPPTEPTEPPTEPTEPSEPEEPKEPTEVAALKPGHTLNLQSDISINYLVSLDKLAEYDRYEFVCYVGEDVFPVEGVQKDKYMYFTLTGLNALRMNDVVRGVLTAYKGDEVFVSPMDEYSIATYAYSMMNRAGVTDQVKRLCANLLRYGAAAQIYKGYHVENLPDSNLTEEQKAYLTDLDTVEFAEPYTIMEDVAAPTVTWQGRALMLDSTVGVKFMVHAPNVNVEEMELRVSYMGIDGEAKKLTIAPTVQNAEYGVYMFLIEELDAAELRAELTCQVFVKGEAASQTMIYSAASYGNNKTGDLLNLCKALFAYVDQARAFFA